MYSADAKNEGYSLCIGLLSHYFVNDNLGCVALSIANVRLLDEVAKECGILLKYCVLVNEKYLASVLDFTDMPYEYRIYPSSKEALRRPWQWATSKIFDNCDLVFNLGAGDGFTDIYGPGRLLSETYMSALAQNQKVPLIMAPQTVGPFRRLWTRAIAATTLRRCEHVFVREKLSYGLASQLGVPHAKLDEVIDVAFALPYEQHSQNDGRREAVGVNISGLLYRGGYDRRNYFGLSFDYRLFSLKLVEALASRGCEVHLIPHVLGRADSIDDDYSACQEVAGAVGGCSLAPAFADPSAAKEYISGMSFFVGARMHSTIAALSSGIPTVGVGYSQKMKGLYDTLDYPYYVDACGGTGLAQAIDFVLLSLSNKHELRNAIEHSEKIVRSRLDLYKSCVKELFGKALRRKCERRDF